MEEKQLQELIKRHDELKTERRKKSREKIKNNLDKTVENEVYKNVDIDSAANTELGIFDAKDFDIPGNSMFLNQFEFSNVAYTPNHLIVVGNLKSCPGEGIIIDYYDRPKGAKQGATPYTIKSVSKITLKDINDDYSSISFTTKSGKNGLIKISGSEIKYEILDK